MLPTKFAHLPYLHKNLFFIKMRYTYSNNQIFSLFIKIVILYSSKFIISIWNLNPTPPLSFYLLQNNLIFKNCTQRNENIVHKIILFNSVIGTKGCGMWKLPWAKYKHQNVKSHFIIIYSMVHTWVFFLWICYINMQW